MSADKLGFEVKILADSVIDGVTYNKPCRLTTIQATFPRSILAEVNTHRMRSLNAASSRAIPAKKQLNRVITSPFVPKFAKNKPGMQSANLLEGDELAIAETLWNDLGRRAVATVEELTNPDFLNIHKQFASRLIEPWMWCTVIWSMTDWDNMFHQRRHEAAEPSFQILANMIYETMDQSFPVYIEHEDWHLPLIFRDGRDNELPGISQFIDYHNALPPEKQLPIDLKDENKLIQLQLWLEAYTQQLISAGRCAKVSYLNLETDKLDHLNDLRLGLFLVTNTPGHFSPLEHQATPAYMDDMVYKVAQLQVANLTINEEIVGNVIQPKKGEIGYCGNFRGWKQFRKHFDWENYEG